MPQRRGESQRRRAFTFYVQRKAQQIALLRGRPQSYPASSLNNQFRPRIFSAAFWYCLTTILQLKRHCGSAFFSLCCLHLLLTLSVLHPVLVLKHVCLTNKPVPGLCFNYYLSPTFTAKPQYFLYNTSVWLQWVKL